MNAPFLSRETVGNFRSSCLSSGAVDYDTSSATADAEGSSSIDVGFFDTRSTRSVNPILRAAALCNTSSRVRFHGIFRNPPAAHLLPGFIIHPLNFTSAHASCIYYGLAQLAHGPGPQYLYKPLLHWILPRSLPRLILLDTDVAVMGDIVQLAFQFAKFTQHAVVGAVPEQSLIYQRSSGGRLRGFNGGVQLLRLDRMRAERSYDQWLDYVASGRDGRRLGYLGDQTLYTILGGLSPQLFHSLPCEWNRQLGSDWDLGPQTIMNKTMHSCPRRCAALHANHPAIKCLCAILTSHPSCDTWKAFQLALASPTGSSGRGPVDLLFGRMTCPRVPFERRKTFLARIQAFFSDCCVQGYRGPLRPPDGMPGAAIVTAGLRKKAAAKGSPPCARGSGRASSHATRRTHGRRLWAAATGMGARS